MVFLPVFKTPQYLSQLISKEQPKGGFAPIFVKKLVLGLILVLDKESNLRTFFNGISIRIQLKASALKTISAGSLP